MSNVIEVDFGRRPDPSMTVEIRNEVLYSDDRVILVRTRMGIGQHDFGTTHFLAIRGGEQVEVIPVNE